MGVTFVELILLISVCLASRDDTKLKWFSTYLEEEASHVGFQFDALAADIDGTYLEFAQWLARNRKYSRASRHKAMDVNNVALHLRVVAEFCMHRSQGCRWRSFYALLDQLRRPFPNEPGPFADVSLEHLRQHGAHVPDCWRMPRAPTAAEFHGLVVANKPIIIPGVAADWPARRLWTYDYLRGLLANTTVVVSATPHGRYDTIEPASAWGITGLDRSNLSANVVVARPGHLKISFAEFIDLLEHPLKIHVANVDDDDDDVKPRTKASSLYLQYFPFPALVRGEPGGDQLAEDIRLMDSLNFASFLAPKYRLVWMGRADTQGSLHFDREENIMVMLRGSKTFRLSPPDSTADVSGGIPLRQASYSVSKVEDKLSFTRDPSKVSDQTYSHHTYGAGNVSKPIDCVVRAGDALYVPAGWWHEVRSHGDEEGKAIGLNVFYHSYYHRPGDNVTEPSFVQRKYYDHIRSETQFGLNLLKTCPGDNICFTESQKSENTKILDRFFSEKEL